MSLEVALQNAISGLNTSKQSLQVISNNIANVNTEGYSRKIVEQTARVIEGTGYGVEISRISRDVDSGILRQLRTESGDLERLTVRQAFLSQVNSLFGRPSDNNSIVHHLSDLGAAFDSLAISPETEANQFLTVNAAVDVVNQLKLMSDEIQRLRSDSNLKLESLVEEFNSKMELVVSLNSDIIEFGASNVATADLEDQRDQALNRMSEIMDIKYFEKSDGSLTVFTGGGQTLIDGQAQELSYNRPSSMVPTLEYLPTDAINYLAPSESGYPVGGVPGIFVGEEIASQDITSTIGSGELSGLIGLRDSELPALQEQIDELSEKLKDAVNATHNQGAGFPPVVSMTSDRFVASATAFSTAGATGLVRIGLVDESGALQTGDQVFDLSTYATVGALVTALDGMTNLTASINSSGRLELTAQNNYRIGINELTSEVSAASDLEKGFSDFFGLNNFFSSGESFSRYRSDLFASDTASAITTGGTLQFTASGVTTTVTYAANDSITDLADAINANATLTTAAITAEIVADGDGFRLQITDDDGDDFAIVETGSGTALEETALRCDYRGLSKRLSVRTDIVDNSFYVSRGTLHSNTFESTLAGISNPSTTFGAAVAGTLTFTMPDGTTATITYDGSVAATDSLDDIATAINSNTNLLAANISAEVVVSAGDYSLKITDANSDDFWVVDSTGDLGVETDQGVSPGDGSIAADIAATFAESQTFLAAGGLARTDATFADYGASILAFNSALVSSVERDLTFQQNLANELFNKNSSISGVNMDEELSNLIIYEEAYLAAARMVTTTQELFKALIQMLG